VADSSALLEVAEQQTVSVAKAGIVCQLRARVSIIASANPKSGMFEKNKTLKDNIKISNAILSRFDLIFLLIDQPNEKVDRVVSEHIVNVQITVYLDEARVPKTTSQSAISIRC
jgi:DNA helicase MCM8